MDFLVLEHSFRGLCGRRETLPVRLTPSSHGPALGVAAIFDGDCRESKELNSKFKVPNSKQVPVKKKYALVIDRQQLLADRLGKWIKPPAAAAGKKDAALLLLEKTCQPSEYATKWSENKCVATSPVQTESERPHETHRIPMDRRRRSPLGGRTGHTADLSPGLDAPS